MDFRLSLDSQRLKLIGELSEELTNILHRYIGIAPDFHTVVVDITNDLNETIGTVETTEDANFEFFPVERH